MLYQTQYLSPLGELTLAGDGAHLMGLWMQGQKYFAASVREPMIPVENDPLFEQAKDWLNRYFAGQRPAPNELPLAPIGGDFRQQVWALLREIPYGETTTYGELAEKMAARRGVTRMSAQAVGGAVGHNPISIIIPCHRVLGKDGSLTGYAGGVEKKAALLAHEKIVFKEQTSQ